MKNSPTDSLYSGHVNKQWVKLLDIMGMNVTYSKCIGTRLWTDDGKCIRDFLSGYCVQNLGHNHPVIAERIKSEIDSKSPMILQSLVPRYAGELAFRLCELAGGGLTHAYFGNTGSEGVEMSIKFARLHTKRSGILYSEGAFHGITYGAMSLMKHSSWTKDCGPFLSDTKGISFLDLEQLEEELKTKKYAAFITEALQSEAGINLTNKDTIRAAQELCNRYGTLFIVDEVQSGMFRTGTFLVSQQLGITPDMVILAKALGGGMMPICSVLMKENINHSVFKKIDSAFASASTFGENTLSMVAALSTVDVIETENLSQNCLEMGELLRKKIGELCDNYEMLKEIRGIGLMNGVEFIAPKSLKLKALYETFNMIHKGLFGQMIVMKMFRSGNVLTQVCGNNYMVIKACPALISTEEDIELFTKALDVTMESFHSGKGFAEGITIGKRALSLS